LYDSETYHHPNGFVAFAGVEKETEASLEEDENPEK